MSPSVDPAGADPLGDVDLVAEQARLNTATYFGRDPEHLVTAVVDGEGVVMRIRFAGTADTRTPEALEQAVVAAVTVAQQRMADAWLDLAARVDPALAAPPREPPTYGGIEQAVDTEAHGASAGGDRGRG